MIDISQGKKEIIRAGSALLDEGLIAGTWGNVSCRIDAGHFLISASGREYETMSEDEVLEVSIEDLSYEGRIEPSSERRVHREIYRLCEDANFIIHTHQHNASAVSAMHLKAIKLDKHYENIGNFVLIADYGLPGSTKLADKLIEAVQGSAGKAIIMSNHGAICYGKDYEEAMATTRALEEACGKYLEYIGLEPWDGEREHFEVTWNKSPVILKYMEHRDKLPAYLDDFAQVIGSSMDIIEYSDRQVDRAAADRRPLLVRGRGAMCIATDDLDRASVSILIEKNCRAALAGIGSKPISKHDCNHMRQHYLRKYSKLKKKKLK